MRKKVTGGIWLAVNNCLELFGISSSFNGHKQRFPDSRRLVILLGSVLLAIVITYCTLTWCVYYFHTMKGVPKRRNFRPIQDFTQIFPEQITPTDMGRSVSHGNKLILLWTPLFNSKDWSANEVFSTRPRDPRCNVTWDRERLQDADALLFHPNDFFSLSEFPRNRLPDQRYTLVTTEPTYYNTFFKMSAYNSLFNWTMNLRHDSDVPLNYGGPLRRRSLSAKDKTRELLTIRENRQRKTGLAVARVGNCLSLHTPRLGYISKLQNYMPLDFYGLCGKNCPRETCHSMMGNYKFFLAFENGFCRDYLTEKMWYPLFEWFSVPVVFGGAHPDEYRKAAPPHSYINVADFASPRELADYLLLLDRNHTLYEEYFSWRLDYTIEFVSPWIQLCNALHNTSKPAQVYTDLPGWFLEDTCHYNEIYAVLTMVPFFMVFMSLSGILLYFSSKLIPLKIIFLAVLSVFAIFIIKLYMKIMFPRM